MMLELILFIAIVAADQLVKAGCASWLPTLPQMTYTLWPEVFSLTYVENRGAAFGLLQNAQVFFIVATVIVCGMLIFIMIKERKRMFTLMRIALSLVLAGAVGNFIDRLALGYVRDMFYFIPIDFPVFNVADSAITIGAILLVLDVLFFKGKKYMLELDERDKQRKAKKEAEIEAEKEKGE